MPGPRQLKIRYVKVLPKLGSGQFGEVYKAIDVGSGKFVAVKILEQPTRALKQKDWKQSLYYALKREVETLSEISYPHIVDYIASQSGGDPQVEIFMGLREGTLESLVESGANAFAAANLVFPQMLQALDCIPDGQYRFQLGDFGLCNRIVDAATFAGSRLYMGPEMFREGNQTHKVDVWSLFVTMLWILDAGGFRQKSISKIWEMAIVNPDERASAAQMLVKYFNGVGLSTPRN
ncbi:kinase-like domain-containing protein [Bisporella sp. PMI_857]|nr:kinase-like domain-containing protein [Bisporella sp. PMI_857]